LRLQRLLTSVSGCSHEALVNTAMQLYKLVITSICKG